MRTRVKIVRYARNRRRSSIAEAPREARGNREVMMTTEVVLARIDRLLTDRP
jgi:hypothetical protein